MNIDSLLKSFSVTRDSRSLREKLASVLGGTLTIIALCLSMIYLDIQSEHVLGSANLMVASIAASATLMFAIPHSPLSQPWPIVGGHIISALVGVTCYQNIDNIALAAGLAVGLAIYLMYIGRCLHPPGTATAITAVIGNEEIHNLGFQFVLTPVLSNVVLLLIIALSIHHLMRTGSYPARKAHRNNSTQEPDVLSHRTIAEQHLLFVPKQEARELSREDLEHAMKEMDTFVDVTTEDLIQIIRLASEYAQKTPKNPTLDQMTEPSYLRSL